MADYDTIALSYSDSKRLPFRDHVERYTLFETIGNVRNAHVLDLACGDGYYTRLLKEAGASSVTGVDLSAEMIRLARKAEIGRPLGCSYVCADAADFRPTEPVDLVVAAYLLNYAKTSSELVRFCSMCRESLRPGGRFVGVNDNPLILPDGSVSYFKYGFDRRCDRLPPRDGDPILYTFPTMPGSTFEFMNYYHAPGSYEAAFREAGFRDFRWVSVALEPDQEGDPFWNDFMQNPPIICFSAKP